MKRSRFETIRWIFWLGICVILTLTGCNTTTLTPFPTPTMTSAIAATTEIAPVPTPTTLLLTPVPLKSPTSIPTTRHNPTVIVGPDVPTPVPFLTSPVDTGSTPISCPAPISSSSIIQQDDDAGWHHYWAATSQVVQVHDLFADDEWLWIAAGQGLIRLNQRSLEYELFSHTNTTPDIMLDRVYTLAVDDQGRLWAGGAHGLVRYDNKEWKVIYTDKPVSDFALDDTGNLWYFTFYARQPAWAYRFQGQEPPTIGDWTPEQVAYQASFRDSANWRLLALYGKSARTGEEIRDVNGNKWACNMHDILAVSVYRNNEKVQSIPMRSIASVNTIAANTVQGGIWIGLDTGLFYSDGETFMRYQFTGKTAVGYPLIYALAFANNGDGWAATSEGVLHFNERTGEWEDVAQVNAAIPFGLSYLIAPDQQDGLWVLGADYLAHFDGKQLERWPIPSEISKSEPRLYAIVQFQDHLWVAAGDRGLWRFDGQAWGKVLPLTILSLAQDHDEKLYILERAREKQQSILVYDGTDWRRLSECVACEWLFPSTLSSDTDQRIWGANTSSIWRYSTDEGWCNILALPDVSDYTSIQVDTHGGLWVANRLGGILHCAQEHCELWKWEEDAGNAITSESRSVPLRPLITAMAADAQGRIWVGGYGLLSVYDPAER